MFTNASSNYSSHDQLPETRANMIAGENDILDFLFWNNKLLFQAIAKSIMTKTTDVVLGH